jgi:uncharacterized protein
LPRELQAAGTARAFRRELTEEHGTRDVSVRAAADVPPLGAHHEGSAFEEEQLNDARWSSRHPISPAAAILGAALVLSSWIIGCSAMRISDSRATITVTGSAKQQIRSDMVVWRGTFSAQSTQLAPAYAELDESVKLVRDYLGARGIADTGMVFSSIQTRTFYEIGTRGIETANVSGYRLMQTVEVRSHDVERIGVLARQSTELIQQGVAFESMPPEYLYTRLADLKVEMLAEATKDARARALEMARNSRSHIGRLRSARMGVFQITPAFSTQVADYGINDTSSLLKDITAVVSMSFEIR